mgnify:CR=1 FL=1
MALKITLHHGKVGEKPVTRKNLEALGPVSYTHLTLPTILLV